MLTLLPLLLQAAFYKYATAFGPNSNKAVQRGTFWGITLLGEVAKLECRFCAQTETATSTEHQAQFCS